MRLNTLNTASDRFPTVLYSVHHLLHITTNYIIQPKRIMKYQYSVNTFWIFTSLKARKITVAVKMTLSNTLQQPTLTQASWKRRIICMVSWSKKKMRMTSTLMNSSKRFWKSRPNTRSLMTMKKQINLIYHRPSKDSISYKSKTPNVRLFLTRERTLMS